MNTDTVKEIVQKRIKSIVDELEVMYDKAMPASTCTRDVHNDGGASKEVEQSVYDQLTEYLDNVVTQFKQYLE